MSQKHSILNLGDMRFEMTTEGDQYQGLGRIWIGQKLVRSGKLALSPMTQTFQGLELAGLRLIGVKKSAKSLRISLEAGFRRMPVGPMKDHSLDPIHDLTDWGTDDPVAVGQLDVVILPTKDRFYTADFEGFSYHYEYRSRTVPLFWLMDRATWELDGDIAGVVAVSQSSCSAPVARFKKETEWSTEGKLFFLSGDKNVNPIMTHNLPRWASHGSFDFQVKDGSILAGVFKRVGLVRSVICRDAGQAELKHFDKHIFDQTFRFQTIPKKILLHQGAYTETTWKNVWTWIHEDVEDRAREEFGLKKEPASPVIGQNFWVNLDVKRYYEDLIPAAAAIGCRYAFVDNLKKSAYTDRTPFPGKFNWNMCCGHEYEIAPEVGGENGVRKLVADAAEMGVIIQSWTNNDQALSSPLNASERDEEELYVLMEDTRQKWGGAYTNVMSVLDFAAEKARRLFVDSHIAIKEKTGLSHYLYDSFYNLAFMTVTYRSCSPRTQWRQLLGVFAELQKAGIHFRIESFGPFGQPQHGHPSSYNYEAIFACYRVGVGNDYSTVPTNVPLTDLSPRNADAVFYLMAHMALVGIPLEQDGERIDKIWGDDHRQALRDYHAVLDKLDRRILQEDGLGVLWLDKTSRVSTFFNFQDRELPLEGQVTDITTGKRLRKAKTYALEARHIYQAKLKPILRGRKRGS